MNQRRVRVVFDNDDLAISGEAGDRLLDLCDEVGASVPFSCRDASCATCLIDVVSGEELLAGPTIHERRLLARIGAGATQRLACQATITAGEGDLHIVPSASV